MGMRSIISTYRLGEEESIGRDKLPQVHWVVTTHSSSAVVDALRLNETRVFAAANQKC